MTSSFLVSKVIGGYVLLSNDMEVKSKEKFYSFSNNFTEQDGFIFCENLRIRDIQNELDQKFSGCLNSPVFIYSKAQIKENILSYQEALKNGGIPYKLGFSIKSNYNPHLVRLVCREHGCVAITVSGNEVKLALQLGVQPDDIVFSGNGKQKWELELVVTKGCLINIDSDFDLKHLIEVTNRLETNAKILLRLNPDIDANVHPFLSTGLAKSKFGISDDLLFDMLTMIRSNGRIQLVGLHCHLGSTIDNTLVFNECLDVMLDIAEKVKKSGITTLRMINLGGGLGINYRQHEFRTSPNRDPTFKTEEQMTELLDKVCHIVKNDSKTEICRLLESCQNSGNMDASDVSRLKELLIGYTSLQIDVHKLFPRLELQVLYPKPTDLISSVGDKLLRSGFTVILEPGRSIIGNAGMFITKVIGTKTNGRQKYIVVDGSMTEVIRPALYGAYHHIELTEPSTMESDKQGLFDVVGPVCECGDILGKNRFLPRPHEGCGLAVFDTGAYGSCMASNYNMRPRPAEILVDGSSWKVIRMPETLEDIISTFQFTF